MEQLNLALEPVRAFLVQLGEFLPRLVLAVVILVIGWLIAKFVRFVVVRGLTAVRFNVLTEKASIDGFLKKGGLKLNTVGILGALFYWLAILAAVVVAFNTLGLAYVTDLVGRILLFIPKVIVAVLILAIGFYFAHFAADTVITFSKNVGMEEAQLLGRVTRYAIIVFVVLISLDQVNVGGDIIRQSFLIVLSGVVLALALAFGLSGQRRAGDLLDRWKKKEGRGK